MSLVVVLLVLLWFVWSNLTIPEECVTTKTPIKCFWIEPTDTSRVVLRRYVSSSDGGACHAPHGYHDASVVCEDVPNSDHDMINPETGTLYYGRSSTATDKQRLAYDFPTKCDGCDYEFAEEDKWQWNLDLVWVRTDTSELALMSDMPSGAMWDATWWGKKGGDGRCIVVKTPGGDWMIDCKANNSDEEFGWERTGEPLNLTVTPSIAIGRRGKGRYFHAFLTNGELVRCGDSEV